MPAYDDDFDDACILEGPDTFRTSRAAFEALTVTLGSAQAASWTHDQLEGHLDVQGREVLRLLYQDHLDLRALREQHAVGQAVAHGQVVAIIDAEGVGHRKVEQGHRRHLQTVFGMVGVTRCAWRADGARNLYPADATLNLPDHLHSHTLQQRAATEAVRGSFQAAEQALSRQCGKVAGKRQVEQLTMAAAADIDTFYTTSAPPPCSDDTLPVCSVDGKGVVMRPEALREETRKAAQAKGSGTYRTRLASGESTAASGWPPWGPSTMPTPPPDGPTTCSPRPSPWAPPAMLTIVAVGGAARVRSPPASG
jgi:hypothetical protein